VVHGTLDEGRQAHIAITSDGGPHVTPDLYAWSGGSLWFAVATSTLKARVLAREPAVGAVVSIPGRSVLLAGQAHLYDPRSLLGLARRLPDLPRTTVALTRFTVRNAPDLLAFVGDTATGRLGLRPPPLRVLVRLDPDRAVLLEGDEVVEGYGRWAAIRPSSGATLPGGGEAAVVALPGSVAVPGRWYEEDRCVRIAPGLRALVDLSGSFPMAVVVDEYGAPGPAAKQGTLLRGRGRLTDGDQTIEVQPERLVTWEGVETDSEAWVATGPSSG
jgi:hypothetical protein